MSYVHVSSTGEVSSRNPDANSLAARTPDAQPAPEAKVSAPRGRVTAQSDGDGNITITEHVTGSYQAGAEKSDNPLLNARNAFGPVTVDALTPDSIIEGRSTQGSLTLATALSLGWAVAKPGGGYEWVGVDGQGALSQDAPKAEEKKAEEKPKDEQDASEVVGQIAGTTAEVDAFQKLTTESVPEPVRQGTLQALYQESDSAPFVAQIASATGRDASEIQGQIERATAEYTKAGQDAARNMGLDVARDWDTFRSHIWSTDPNAAQDAVAALVENHDPRPLQRLAGEFVKNRQNIPAAMVQDKAETLDDAVSDVPLSVAEVSKLSFAEVKEATLGAGLRLRHDGSGRIMVQSREWDGEVELRSAVKAGLLVIRGGA